MTAEEFKAVSPAIGKPSHFLRAASEEVNVISTSKLAKKITYIEHQHERLHREHTNPNVCLG